MKPILKCLHIVHVERLAQSALHTEGLSFNSEHFSKDHSICKNVPIFHNKCFTEINTSAQLFASFIYGVIFCSTNLTTQMARKSVLQIL